MDGAFVFLSIVIAAIAFVWMRQRQLEREAAWRGAADRIGFGHQPAGFLSSGAGTLSGVIQGVSIVCDTYDRSRDDDSEVWSRVSASLRGLEGISLTAEADRSLIGKLVVGEDLQTGDGLFDELIFVNGPPVRLRALLDAQTRRKVAWFVSRGGRIRDGRIVIEQKGVAAPLELQQMVRDVADLARELGRDRGTPAAALRDVACGDSLAEVRLATLRTLLESFPRDEQTKAACEHALNDVDARLRCEAAIALRALPQLRELMSSPDVRLKAFRALVELRGAGDETIAFALDSDDPALQLEAVNAARDPALFDRIVKLGPRSSDVLAEAIARTLGALGDPRAERPLLLLLQRDASVVKQAAAEALGGVGSVAAVEPLLPLTQGVLTGTALKEAARDAIRRIQERLGDADAGRVSLADAQGGEVSLSVPAGAVSKVRG